MAQNELRGYIKICIEYYIIYQIELKYFFYSSQEKNLLTM